MNSARYTAIEATLTDAYRREIVPSGGQVEQGNPVLTIEFTMGDTSESTSVRIQSVCDIFKPQIYRHTKSFDIASHGYSVESPDLQFIAALDGRPSDYESAIGSRFAVQVIGNDQWSPHQGVFERGKQVLQSAEWFNPE